MSVNYKQTDVLQWLDQSAFVLRDILGQSRAKPEISTEVRHEFSSKLKIVAGVVSYLARQEQHGLLSGEDDGMPPEEINSELQRRLTEIRTLALSVADVLRSRMAILN